MDAIAIDDATHGRAVVGHLVDPAAVRVVTVLSGAADGVGDVLARVQIRRPEREVVLEKIDVPEHVAHHELLIGEAVALEQVRRKKGCC